MSYADTVCDDCHFAKYINGKFCKDCVEKRVNGYDNLKELVEKIKKESKHHAYQYCNCPAHQAIQKLLIIWRERTT